jgi:PilZ domain
MDEHAFHERRRYPRMKVAVPVELKQCSGSCPLRVTTTELSLCGFYIETMFTLPKGAELSIALWVDGRRLAAKGVVATHYPQVGNGIDITEMSSADRASLHKFCETQEPSSLLDGPFSSYP